MRYIPLIRSQLLLLSVYRLIQVPKLYSVYQPQVSLPGPYRSPWSDLTQSDSPHFSTCEHSPSSRNTNRALTAARQVRALRRDFSLRLILRRLSQSLYLRSLYPAYIWSTPTSSLRILLSSNRSFSGFFFFSYLTKPRLIFLDSLPVPSTIPGE